MSKSPQKRSPSTPKKSNRVNQLMKAGSRLGIAVTIGAIALIAWVFGSELILKGCLFGAAVFALNLSMDWLSGGRKR